jgi:hypothetical protein
LVVTYSSSSAPQPVEVIAAAKNAMEVGTTTFRVRRDEFDMVVAPF